MREHVYMDNPFDGDADTEYSRLQDLDAEAKRQAMEAEANAEFDAVAARAYQLREKRPSLSWAQSMILARQHVADQKAAQTETGPWETVGRRANVIHSETGMPLLYALEQAQEEILGIKRTRYWKPPKGGA